MTVRKTAVAVILMLVALAVPIQATGETTLYDVDVYLDEVEVVFPDDYGHPFIDEANRTQMPFRVILESYGAVVTWDGDNRIATAKKGDIEVQVPIGERFIIRNTEIIAIDTRSLIVQDRTYIPLRAVMEAFGSVVNWNEELRRVEIETGNISIISRLPETYDLRNLQRLTGVKDQHEIGACWAFATLGAIESCLLPGQSYDFSEDHMSLTHGYNLTQDEGGDFQISLAYLARWSGPVYEIQDPYGDGVTNDKLKAAIHIQEAMILPSKDFSSIKRAVMTFGGVQTSIHIRDIYEQELGEAYNSDNNAFYYKGTVLPNHDVVIVGWDDTYSPENFNNIPEKPGAFICRNSYGDYFGDAGYFYVSYEDVWIGDESIVYTRIEGNDNYDKIYQSDWLGWVGRIGYGKDTAYFSNIFTTDGEESLEAVSFYATDRDSSYEVYTVPSFTDIADFDDMKFITRGTLDYAGYYTVDFEEPIQINGDYAVVVKITTPDSLFPVAAEFYKDVAWLQQVDLSDGRGFMSYDTATWESTEEILESNVSLKAFTNKIEVTSEEVDEDL